MKHKKYAKLLLTLSIIWLGGSVSTYAGDESPSYQALLYEITEKHIAGIGFWIPDDQYQFFCIIAWHTKEEDPFQRRKMSFFQQIDHQFIEVYRETKIGYGFDSMYPINNDLLTIWAAGSGFNFRVFSWIDDEIQVTLDTGSQQFPEIVDVDNDGYYEILVVSEGKFMINAGDRTILQLPETTAIYKWDGQKYDLWKTVPWKQRFCEK